MTNLFKILALGLLLGNCSHKPKQFAPHSAAKIDFHQHFKESVDIDEYFKVMKHFNIKKSVLLALKSPHNEYHDQNLFTMKMYKKYPKFIVPFVTFVENEPNALKIVKKFHKQGAKGIKFIGWLGRQVERYNFDLLKTSLLKVYRYCEIHDLPILFHIDFRKHEKKFHNKMATILRKFPNLKVIVAHGGIDLKNMRDFERHLTHPNFYIDLSFYGTYKEYWFKQVSRHRTKIRRFILKYPDQFLWATDLFPSSKKDDEYMYNVIEGSIQLVEDASYHRTEFKKLHKGKGLKLPPKILKKIYYKNAAKVLSLGNYGSRKVSKYRRKP